MNNGIIVINSGSTSLKFALYELNNSQEINLKASGSYTEMPNNTQFKLKDAQHNTLIDKKYPAERTISHEVALKELIPLLEQHYPQLKISYAGHRIVSGGERFSQATLLDDEKLEYLDQLSKIVPTHQHFEVLGAKALAKVYPHILQTASFDTSFHHSMVDTAKNYAVPAAISQHIRHWGYHGISYQYISSCLPELVPNSRRVIAAHLGGGASLCAMLDGKSIDTTMQFGSITGLPMATRSGDFPADAIFYLLKEKLFTADQLERMLSKESGLLGLSGGLSQSMKVLEDSQNQNAIKALEYFDYALLKFIGAYTAILGGLDALIFTAGIGENDSALRQRICNKLDWLGIEIDPEINQKAIGLNTPTLISTATSKVCVFVIPTNEELMIAKSTVELAIISKVS